MTMSRVAAVGLAGMGVAAMMAVWVATHDAERVRLQLDAAQARAAARADRIALLEAQLASALAGQQEVRDLLTERRASEEAARAQREARVRAAMAPLPEGLRLTLETISDLLRRSGHDLRFLRVRAIDDKAMHDVELYEPGDAVSAGGVLWRAARVEFRLDRASGALILHFREGTVIRGGERFDLPAGGESLTLEGVPARECEARLPHLVRAEGEYPVPPPRVPARARLDAYTAGEWRARLNELLTTARTKLRYQVSGLQGLDEARFFDVILLGHDDGRVLAEAADAAQLAVVVDEAAGTVELELQGGTMRRAGGDSPIPDAPDAQRILLVGVTPEAAMRTLTGMVVRR